MAKIIEVREGMSAVEERTFSLLTAGSHFSHQEAIHLIFGQPANVVQKIIDLLPKENPPLKESEKATLWPTLK